MEIKKFKDAALHTKAIEVEHGEDISDLIDGMSSLMRKAKGIGIAANQVGVLKRVIILASPGVYLEIINPVITRHTDLKKNSKEGCLSFPGKSTTKKRFYKVTVEGFDRNWNPVSKNLKALGAYCAQHEIDHLNGVTI